MVGKREDTAGEHQRPPDSSALAKLISARQKKTLGFAAVRSGRNSVDGRRVEKVDGNLAIVLQYIFYTCTHIRYDRCLFPSSVISTIHSRMQATEVIAILFPIYQGYNVRYAGDGQDGFITGITTQSSFKHAGGRWRKRQFSSNKARKAPMY